MSSENSPLLSSSSKSDVDSTFSSGSGEQRVPASEHVFRYIGLLFICLVPLGSYYIYDLPGAFGDEIISTWFNVDEVNYGILYSVYSFPNIVMVLVGGYLMDSVLGIRKSLLIFTGFVTVGQILLSIAASLKIFWLAVLGRVVYGLGAESLYICSFAFVALWFMGRGDYGFAFALVNTVGRIAGATDLNVSVKIASKFNLPAAFDFGALLCIVCFVLAIVLAILEGIRIKKDNLKLKEIQVIGEVDGSSSPPSDPVSEFKFSDIKSFPLSYWLLVLVFVCFLCPTFVFITIAKDFFQEYFSTLNSSGVISLPYYVAAGAPVVGLLVDKFGRHLSFILIAGIFQLLCFIFIGFTNISPFLSMSLLGISIATLFSGMSVIAAIVKTKFVGIGYGIVSSIGNGSIAILTIIVNALLQRFNNNYMIPIGIFIGMSVIAVLSIILLGVIDIKYQALNVSPEKLQQKIKELNEEDEKDPLLVN